MSGCSLNVQRLMDKVGAEVDFRTHLDIKSCSQLGVILTLELVQLRVGVYLAYMILSHL